MKEQVVHMVKRAISLILSILMIFSIIPLSKYDKVYAATQLTAQQIVEYFNSKVGGTADADSCLAFVANGFQALGAARSSECCAWNYGNTFCTHSSRDDIPIGADVFFNSEGTKVDAVYHGHHCGHIGVYVGDGYIVHASSKSLRVSSVS